MRITFLLARYSVTGVPLAQLRFARALARRGHSVTLIIGFIDNVDDLPILDDINVMCWKSPKVRGMVWPLMRYLKRDKPDVVFSAEDHLTITVLVASILSVSSVKISGSSRILPNDRFAYSNTAFTKGWFLKQVMKSVMWRADALTCVSKDMVQLYQQIFNNPPHVAVYNIIKDEQSRLRAEESVDHPWLVAKECPVIVSAGTMTKRKGFGDLLMSFAELRKKRPARLIILGDGYLRPTLMDLAQELGVENDVDMPGRVDNPLKYFSKADVFVLSSYAEGLPNVLVEAMMCGCTPVATDCPTGPREVLQDGTYGYLVPMHDPAAMAVAIEQALVRPIPRLLLDEGVKPFEESRVIDRHFEVLGLCEKLST